MRFPLRFRLGEIEKLTEGSDQYYAHLLAMTCQILEGELPLTPEYGVPDPVFDESAKRQLAFIAGAFIPEISIQSVSIGDSDIGESKVNITFARRD
jgi:hypothetical protein